MTTDQIQAATESSTEIAENVRQKVREILPLIRESAPEIEEARQLPESVISALTEAGVFKMTVPKRYGGYELPWTDVMETLTLIGSADGSTAWVSTLINVCDWMVGMFPDQAQEEVWGANPEARVCGVLAPTATTVRVEGGLRVTGSWGFASGSRHSQWAGLGIPVVDGEGNQIDQGLALIPVSELGYKDTWHVAGMQGTGSNTFTADDVFVPDHRILSVTTAMAGSPATEHTDEALYRTALVPVLAIVLTAPMVGMAEGALERLRTSLAKGKGISYTFYDDSRQAGSTQIGLAQAAIEVDTARLHMERAVASLDAHAAAGTYPDTLERARTRMDTGYIAVKAREAVDAIVSVGGAGSFAQANDLQRIWRDINTGSRHAIVGPGISAELYGRALLGVEEQVTPFI